MKVFLVPDYRCFECGATLQRIGSQRWDGGFLYVHAPGDGNPHEYKCSQVGKEFNWKPTPEDK